MESAEKHYVITRRRLFDEGKTKKNHGVFLSHVVQNAPIEQLHHVLSAKNIGKKEEEEKKIGRKQGHTFESVPAGLTPTTLPIHSKTRLPFDYFARAKT
jgi:hypothetical protein